MYVSNPLDSCVLTVKATPLETEIAIMDVGCICKNTLSPYILSFHIFGPIVHNRFINRRVQRLQSQDLKSIQCIALVKHNEEDKSIKIKHFQVPLGILKHAFNSHIETNKTETYWMMPMMFEFLDLPFRSTDRDPTQDEVYPFTIKRSKQLPHSNCCFNQKSKSQQQQNNKTKLSSNKQ